ncbi:hypothetical protein GPJ56_006356 [Histomonas meleagridis]|uniref:uncharacterized protein n=1 Tax=Histomonas meleagridis TaxID=135588 RepID=UPI003559BDBB|nr:hypothetical protein GPJ56_006356 [Histomonas meleagridis]KAH0796827.1 hypothetical protein GO595_010720 [Histomonas meleagridis]
MFMSRTGFNLIFLEDLLSLIKTNMPSTPFDFTNEYIDDLNFLQKGLSYHSFKPMGNFYDEERKITNIASDKNIFYSFPEFFVQEMLPPTKPTITINIAHLNAVNLTPDSAEEELRIFNIFNKSYMSIKGIPFWHILPYWVALTNQSLADNDYVPPTITQDKHLKVIENQTGDVINVTFLQNKQLPLDSLIMYSSSSMFETVEVIRPNDLPTKVRMNEGKTYVSVTGCDWSYITIELPKEPPKNRNRNQNQTNITVKVDKKLHDEFIKDMESFAIKWTNEDTSLLSNLLPMNEITNESFSSIENIVPDLTTLTDKFTVNAIKLRALITNHVNYISVKFAKQIDEKLLEPFSSYYSSIKVADQIMKLIKFSQKFTEEIHINRFEAHKLINDKNGPPSNSIIAQLSRIISKNPSRYRTLEIPFKVTFRGENAIDAGGPQRELLTEAASSIFEPTSKICYGLGEFYVPYIRTIDENDKIVLTGIGVYIGIIIHTGFVQDLPFSDLVWKYLAKGHITKDDIVINDRELSENFKKIKAGTINAKWTIKNWDGEIVPLPNHSPSADVEESQIDNYIDECLKFRLNGIINTLKPIYNGLTVNLGIPDSSSNLLNDHVLSFLAQGSSVITVEQIKKVTVVFDFQGGIKNKYVEYLWAALERFTQEQMVLFLKFVTTLTRFPTREKAKDFVIKIDMLSTRGSPDRELPTASTCFNKLHWITYSNEEIAYQKLLYAVTNCQTMELQ